jgi:MATE family multidrug resistance protein
VNSSIPNLGEHPFVRAPNRTLISMSLPVMLSLVAEPLTGLVDTAFISRLGAVSLAAVGVGTTALSSVFWAFNFLGIGTQTEVASAFGRQEIGRAVQMGTVALLLSAAIGIVLIGAVLPLSSWTLSLMGATEDMHASAYAYFRIRLFGAPAVLITIAAFGILRGLQDMGTPLKIAVGFNAVNILLDWIFIFGAGPIPPLGVSGAALASVISQWIGAVWAAWAVYAGRGLPGGIQIRDARKLLVIGGDLFVRTGMLNLFLLVSTRSATLVGADSGAAHQAIRQFWLLTALFLDAFAISGQSLIGYFMGSEQKEWARRVAGTVCLWSLAIGFVLSIAMVAGGGLIASLLVPMSALGAYRAAWTVNCMIQPLNALAFGTDGILWGVSDFRYLRNVVVLASSLGLSALYILDERHPDALMWIWIIIGAWIAIRAVFGVARVWPGIGNSPLRQ